MVRYRFQLFVNGKSPQSMLAVANFEALQALLIGTDHELDVFDIVEQPEVAEQYRLLATPTLIKVDPSPAKRVIGDLSDTRAVATALGLDLISGAP